MALGPRNLGEPRVRSEDASWVAHACRQGYGGARAWGCTRGAEPPHIWLRLTCDEITHW